MNEEALENHIVLAMLETLRLNIVNNGLRPENGLVILMQALALWSARYCVKEINAEKIWFTIIGNESKNSFVETFNQYRKYDWQN